MGIRSYIDREDVMPESDRTRQMIDGAKYDIKLERSGGYMVVRWGITCDAPEAGGRLYAGEGVVSLPLAVYNHLTSAAAVEE